MSDAQILSLYKAHQQALTTYAGGIVGDKARAEDIIQDAYLRFSEALSHEWCDNPVGYLYRIVRNLALDTCRRRQFERNLFSHDIEDVAEAALADPVTPERRVIALDELEQLQVALEALPERTRLALEMHRLGGYKLREIAEHLDISPSMAQYLVKQGIQACQRHIDRATSR